MKQQGFTLIELLVGMALLAIITNALFAFQQNSMKAASALVNSAQRMQTLQDAANYLSDRVRSAGSISDTLILNGVPCSAVVVTTTCFAMNVPLPNGTVQTLAYQLILRKSLSSDDKKPDAWADDSANNVYALVEYRVTAAKLNDPISVVNSDAPNVVMDYVSLNFSNTAPATRLFQYDATNQQVTLNLQTVQLDGKVPRFTPTTGPLTVQVNPKNLP